MAWQSTVKREHTKRVSDVMSYLKAAHSRLARAEEELKAAKEEVRFLEEQTIPHMMIEQDLQSYETSDGSRMTLKHDVYGSIGEDNRQAAHQWLDDHGYGDLIKTEVALIIPRDRRSEVVKVQAELDDLFNFELKTKESVHHQTLNKFLRESLEGGLPIPYETFNATPIWKVVLKNGK